MGDEFQALLESILEDNRERAEELLRKKPSLVTETDGTNEQYATKITHWFYAGDTALHLASAAYRLEIGKTLLESGADVSAAKNRRKSQPIHYAADGSLSNPSWEAARQVAMLRLLFEAGADIEAQDANGATPLHRAVRTRCAAAVRFLLDAGANAVARNKSGSTPFHLAVQNTGRGGSGTKEARAAQHDIIVAFLERGADPYLEDGNGRSVLQWARSAWIKRALGHVGAPSGKGRGDRARGRH